jgi:gamma-glutamyltranspeptidase/glutathione hydrolase
LNILKGYDLSTMTREAALHYYLEASRFSFADRNAYLADPDYFAVPLRGLLSDGFAGTRRALITSTAATSPVLPGDPYPFNGGGGAAAAAVSTDTQPRTTTHITTADRWGNVVSYTFTIESTGGAGMVVPGFGFLVNNELTDFNFDSLTHPNRVERRQAAAQLDESDDRLAGRKPVSRRWIAGRLDDHHDGPADPCRPS